MVCTIPRPIQTYPTSCPHNTHVCCTVTNSMHQLKYNKCCTIRHATCYADCVWNVMAHAQKPDFVFRRNGRVHLNRRGASVQSTTGSRAVHISLQGLYCSCKPVFCCHVTLTGYPLHSLVSPSLLLACVTVCHHISKAVYKLLHVSAQSCHPQAVWHQQMTVSAAALQMPVDGKCSSTSDASWR
jgi:hypothetical protein